MYPSYRPIQIPVSNEVGTLHNGVSNGVDQYEGVGLTYVNGEGPYYEAVSNNTNRMVKVTIINTTSRVSSDQRGGTSKLNHIIHQSKSSQNLARNISKTLSFTIYPDDTVATLKSMIVAQAHCSSWPEQCVLYFQGRNLCDDHRLKDYGISNGEATLLMVESCIENMARKSSSSENQITVELRNKTTFKINVNWRSDIVEDVKNEIATVLRIPVHGFHLKYQDTFLKNGELISRYMSPGSLPIVRMITDDDIREAETGNVKILLELESGEMIPIESIHDTIAGLKHQIEIMTKIPMKCQCLVFNGDELQDDRKLSSCHLQRGNVVAVKRIDKLQ